MCIVLCHNWVRPELAFSTAAYVMEWRFHDGFKFYQTVIPAAVWAGGLSLYLCPVQTPDERNSSGSIPRFAFSPFRVFAIKATDKLRTVLGLKRLGCVFRS